MKQSLGLRRKVSIVLFIIYSIVLVYLMFFADTMGRVNRSIGYSYNLMPLREIKRFITKSNVIGMKSVLINLAGNVAAFIPFGLFVIPVSGRKFKFIEAFILTFDVSLMIEIIQLFTKVGSFDVDDILLNTVGGVIGIGMYYLWKFIERKYKDGKAQI